MVYKKDRQYTDNDHLRARFTMWLNTTLMRARMRYLQRNAQQLDVISLDAGLLESIPDPVDYFSNIDCRKTAFNFAEERLANAFSELTLMRQEVLRLLFVEEKTPEEIANQLHISVNSVYQFKYQSLEKLRHLLRKGNNENGQSTV